MRKTYQIFVPEWVPLENKGEEAIIRGMADVLFPEGDAEFHILDMGAREYRFADGFHVYPGAWFYSSWRSQEFGLGLSLRKLYASSCSLLRNGLNKVAPNWVKIPQWPVKNTARLMRKIRAGSAIGNKKTEALKRILTCDYLIAGHDAALNEYDCHVIDMMRDFGMRFGVFGTSMRPAVKSPAIIDVFRNTLQRAEFIYCRNQIAVDWAAKHFPLLDIKLAPDPAFGMLPASKEKTSALIESEGLTKCFQKPVVMVTSAEPAPIARHCFSEAASPEGKLGAHRELLAALTRHAVNVHGANVLFLPHAIGPGPDLDDRRVARGILQRAGLPADRAMVLETELSARDLKGLMREAHVLVAERIHSMIGAVGVHTPFCCLGSKTDTRVRGIVGNMLNLEDVIYHLNSPCEKELFDHFDKIWRQRDKIRERLGETHARLDGELKRASETMRMKMNL